MTQTPPAWHPDPHVPGQQRYWDGTAWTDHVAPLLPTNAYGGGSYGGPATTPDGQRLAGWWRRVGAAVIDGIITGIVGAIAAFPFWQRVIDVYIDFVNDSIDASESGATPPSAMDIQNDVFGDLAAIALIGLVINLVYTVGFLAWKQGTPGKLMLGMRVRRRDTPGPLPLGVILRRWATVAVPSGLGLVPILGTFASLFVLLDYLWPLWDSKKQAIHDKAAGTNVVMDA